MNNPRWYPEERNIPLLVDFILWFSRLEYALKCNANFSSNVGYFHADWPKFQNVLEKCPVPPELSGALIYIKDNPPMKQDGAYTWSIIAARSDWDLLVKALKTVRNNLFHGGKHHMGPVLQPVRDKELLSHCVTVMKGMVSLAPEEVQRAFEEAE